MLAIRLLNELLLLYILAKHLLPTYPSLQMHVPFESHLMVPFKLHWHAENKTSVSDSYKPELSSVVQKQEQERDPTNFW